MPIPEIPQDALAPDQIKWPLDDKGYFVANDGSHFKPNSAQESFINSNSRFAMMYSGRGGGKSASGSQKAMKKIMLGLDGAIMNPDFENFKFSTWPEFKKWIPWGMVIPSQRGRKSDAWQPTQPFVMVFLNGARVYCKGLKDADSARGPNINWLWYDEAGRDMNGSAWQIATASIRVGKNPQAWCTNTAKPTFHWTYKFFIKKDISAESIREFGLLGKSMDDIVQAFHTTTNENKDNLDPGFYASLLATYHAGAERERELNGNYVDDGGNIGDSSKIIKIKEMSDEWKFGRTVRYWDMAATEKKLGAKNKNNPDEFVGTKVQECFKEVLEEGKHKTIRQYVVMDQVGGFFAWEKLLEAITNTSLEDGPACTVVIEQEPASGGKNQVAAVQLHFKKNQDYPELQYFKVEGQRPTDRVQEAYTWFGYANAGNVFMIENEAWNSKFSEQVDGFPNADHDDRLTSCSGAMRWLSPKFKKWSQASFLSI
jgi:predicted phage terminase large subunit-like protein